MLDRCPEEIEVIETSTTDERQANRHHLGLIGTGVGATVIGSLVWSAGIIAERTWWIDDLTLPGAGVTIVGIGMMATGSVLHHRNQE